MEDLLIWLAITTAIAFLAVAVAVLIALHSLQRTNRVARRSTTPAPLLWIWLPTAPARLHRRLRAAIGPVDPDGPSGLPSAPRTDELRCELTDRTVELDRWLVWADRVRPRSLRRTHLSGAEVQVAVVEDLAARLCGMEGSGAAHHAEGELADLAEQVLLLEAARRELDAGAPASAELRPAEELAPGLRPPWQSSPPVEEDRAR